MSRIDLDNPTKTIYSKDELEEMAEEINRRYSPERLEKASPFDPYLFLDKLGYEYRWAQISPGLQISAMTFFDDGRWYLWPKPSFDKGDVPTEAFFPKGTVLVNTRLTELKKFREAERFAVTHEGCHTIKDRRFFETHADAISSICKANDSRKVYWTGREPTIELIERQNDYLTAAVLMPRAQIKRLFFETMRRKSVPEEPIRFEDYMKQFIAKVARAYGVSFNAAKYRLQDIGVLADPRLEAIDD